MAALGIQSVLDVFNQLLITETASLSALEFSTEGKSCRKLGLIFAHARLFGSQTSSYRLQ